MYATQHLSVGTLKPRVTVRVMNFSHFTPLHVLLRGFKNSIKKKKTNKKNLYLRWYPITFQMRCQTSRSYITLWNFIFCFVHTADWWLLLAIISESLLITDVGLLAEGHFLIKRQMSGGGILALWHYKSWHRFKILCLLCRPMCLRGKKTVQRATHPSQTPHSDRRDHHHRPRNFLFLHLCCKAGYRGQGGGKGRLGSGKCSITNARSMLTIVTAVSKNKRTTVSPSSSTHYIPMWGVVWCSGRHRGH